MSAMPTSARAVMRIIEGITALCLGSAENLIWVDATDAAAFGDGEHLYLPRPLGLHEEEYGLLLALALREIARIWHSTPESFRELAPGVLGYGVLVEEVRLKMALARTFRGVPPIFAGAAAVVCAQSVASLRTDPADIEHAKALLVWAAAHAVALPVPALRGGLQCFAEVTLQQVGAEHVAQAIEFAQGAGAAGSAAGAVALGSRIWALLHRQQPAGEVSPAASPATGGASGETPSSSEAGVSGAEPAEDARHASPTPSGEAVAGKAPPAVQPSSRSCAGAEQQPAHHEPADPLSDCLARLRGHPHAVTYREQAAALRERGDSQRSGARPVSEAGRAMLASLLDEADTERGLLGTTGGFDIRAEPVPQDLTAQLAAGGGLPQQADQASRLLLDAVPARLVTVLLRELQHVRRRPFQHSVTGPRLAAAKLWRLGSLGDTRLFRKKAPATGIDAAVSLLLDRSASMRRNGFEQAVAVTQALMLALQRIDGVRTSLDVFPGTDAPIEQIVAFGQKANRARQRLGELEPQGGTPTGSAVARRLRQLLDVVAPTKLMVVVTDGQPDPQELALLEAVLVQAAVFGIQVVGVGIGVDIRRRFPASISVCGASELPGALAALFKERLMPR